MSAQQDETPRVIVVSGPPCSGKSTLARQLDGSVGVLVEIDAVFALLFPRSDRNRADRMLAYDAAHAVARELLEHGRSPVLECTYSRRDQRLSLQRALGGAALVLVELRVDPDQAVERFRRRAGASDLDDALVRRRAETYPYSAGALRIRAAGTTPAQVQDWLRSGPEPVDVAAWVRSGNDWTA